jgi:aromatic amino acid aminotransferase I / 2-aminoadipate transaminase
LVHNAYSLNPQEEKSSLSWVWNLFGAGSSKEKTMNITIPKFVSKPQEEVNLATSLQYGPALGILPLSKFTREFVGKVFQPAYENWTTLITTGNTDAWSRAITSLCNSGDFFLTEEWTYPSSMASCQPYNIRPIPVAMDSQGMRVDSLRSILAEWDEAARGARRPHVIYTIPVGQNPSGAVCALSRSHRRHESHDLYSQTMGAERKKAIYDICVEFGKCVLDFLSHALTRLFRRDHRRG